MAYGHLQYASGPTRRRRLTPLMCELLELLLPLALLAAIIGLMAGGLVAMFLQWWGLAWLAFTFIPVVIIVCFEASELLRRTGLNRGQSFRSS
jgi:hypothetical protein